MLIAQISDTHITLPDAEDPPHQPERIKALETFVAHIDGLAEKPDLVLHTGDVTHGGRPEYYETVKAAMKGIGVPVYFALGNRDIAENLVATLNGFGQVEQVEGFLIYAIEGYPVRLIAMDTQLRTENVGTVCSVRLGILDDLLREKPDQPTALFMHHPPFEVTTSKYPFQFNDQVLADAFLGLVSRHRQVVHMFCGHMHRQYDVRLDTCRASCVPSLPPDNRLGAFEPALNDKPLYQMHRWDNAAGYFETSLCAAVLPA